MARLLGLLGFCHAVCLARLFAVILSGVRKHKAKNPYFHFVDTSLSLSMTRLLLAATSVCACCNAFRQTRLCKQIFNYDEIIIQFFTFVAEICKFFQKSVTKNHKKGLQRLKIRAGGGGFCLFVKIFGALFGFGEFFWVC